MSQNAFGVWRESQGAAGGDIAGEAACLELVHNAVDADLIQLVERHERIRLMGSGDAAVTRSSAVKICR